MQTAGRSCSGVRQWWVFCVCVCMCVLGRGGGRGTGCQGWPLRIVLSTYPPPPSPIPFPPTPHPTPTHSLINQHPTLYEVSTGRVARNKARTANWGAVGCALLAGVPWDARCSAARHANLPPPSRLEAPRLGSPPPAPHTHTHLPQVYKRKAPKQPHAAAAVAQQQAAAAMAAAAAAGFPDSGVEMDDEAPSLPQFAGKPVSSDQVRL